MTKKVVVIILLCVMLAICLCACSNSYKLNISRFVGDYKFVDYEEGISPDSSNYTHVGFSLSSFKANSALDEDFLDPEVSGSLVEIRTDGIVFLGDQGEKVFKEKALEQELVDSVNQLIAEIGKNFKLSRNELKFLDTDKSFRIKEIDIVNGVFGRVCFKDHDYKDFDARFLYAGRQKCLQLSISNEVEVSYAVSYIYTIELRSLLKI